MSEQRAKCLRALADFLKSSSCGWWFRVPMLLKKSQESANIPSDQYLPSMTKPFGISHETLVRGLVRLNFASGAGFRDWNHELRLRVYRLIHKTFCWQGVTGSMFTST
jgi:hypothetical protein